MTTLFESAPFDETTYGIAKRLAVVTAWIDGLAGHFKKARLSILDFGCGTGEHLTVPLAALGHAVLGVDMHATSIEQARTRHTRQPSLRFETAGVETLVSEGRRFDVVICSEVLEHTPDPGGFLRQLRMLMVEEGAMIITTPNGYGSFELFCSVERWMRRHGLHQALRAAFWNTRRTMSRVSGSPEPSRPLEHLASGDVAGFLNFDSRHVQFFTLARLGRLFEAASLRVVAKRARTLLCGPYIDTLFAVAPGRSTLLRWNCRAADLLPLAVAADWMFLLGRNA